VGKYGVLPTFHVTVPSLLPAGTYQWTIYIDIIDNS
jgi:hypothetical protein